MNLKLINTDFTPNGIFGVLKDDTDNTLCYTLQHSYASGNDDGSYAPKVPSGSYLCVRGTHQLDHGGPFEAFEITGVSGHKGILFHKGNYNKDSDGCILLGLDYDQEDQAIWHSQPAFDKFMKLQENINKFTLTVENK